MKARFILPFILFASIILILWRGLFLHPAEVGSPLINQATPSFQLSELFNPEERVSNQNFIGHVTLFNVWATWCYACAHEHAFLLQLAQNNTDNNFKLYGLNYKDDPITAKNWLNQHGNPYTLIAVDQTGQAAIDWGVYGTPETFIIDKKGIIRYKHIGPITAENWEKYLKSIIERLLQEPA